MMSKPKLLFLVTEDWFFCSHRLPLAVAAKSAGYDVTVITRVQKHGRKIAEHGIKVIPWDFSRHSMNPLKEVFVINKLIDIYRKESPDVAHHVSTKPILYGTLAAFFAKVPFTVNALTGIRYNLFFAEDLKTRLLCPLMKLLFKMALNKKNGKVILQNEADLDFLMRTGMLGADKAVMIKGAGVNIREFSFSEEAQGAPVVMLASRMLWDKGVSEFVKTARALKKNYPDVRFVLAGGADPGNPASIEVSQLEQWNNENVIEWWGHRDDMPQVLTQAHIVCLPSYREGLPKVLLEAASCGKPIVTTDTSGCREVVKDGINGFLVPVKDPEKLAQAIEKLIKDPELRNNMGRQGRRIVEEEFSQERIIALTLDLYRSHKDTRSRSKGSSE